MKRQIRIGVDVDGCLRDIFSVFNNIMKRDHPHLVVKPEPDRYNMNNIDLPLHEKIKLWNDVYPEEIYAGSLPIKGAVQSFFKFQKWALERDIRLICVTKQADKNAHYTFSWLHKYGIYFNEYHITGNKHKIGLDYLIDDCPHHYFDWVDYGNKEQNFFLMSACYSQHVPATNRIRNYNNIIVTLNKKRWKKVLV